MSVRLSHQSTAAAVCCWFAAEHGRLQQMLIDSWYMVHTLSTEPRYDWFGFLPCVFTFPTSLLVCLQCLSLQCIDAVGWVAGRASGL